MDSDQKGALSEDKFFIASTTRDKYTPPWLIKVTEAEVEWDVLGIDAFAHVFSLDESEVVRIPIQIKSSRRGVRKFRDTKSAQMQRYTAVIQVHEKLGSAEIRQHLYAELGKFRAKDLPFEEFLYRLKHDTPRTGMGIFRRLSREFKGKRKVGIK